MRKIIAMLSACGLLFLAGCQESSSIGIIGGADGPTSIIVSSVPASGWIWALAAGVIAVAAVLITVIIRRKRK